MKSGNTVFTGTILALSISLLFIAPGCTKKADSDTVAADTPILFGPPGSQFWTTFANAKTLSGRDPVFCATVHSDHEIGTAQDSFQNRYMSAEKEGDTVDLQVVARAEDKYQTAEGMQVLFHQYPVDNAPWIAKTYSAFFMRDANGVTTKVGQIDSEYRQIAGRQSLMSKGTSQGELWTGDANGGIYRLHENGQMVQVGEYDRRWVTPVGQDQRLVLPLMMSRSGTGNSPWVGELGGVIYIDGNSAGG